MSTLDPDKGPYALLGHTPSGATLRWKGELSLQPLVASGTLALENASLAELNAYLHGYAAADIVRGRADLELPYRFALVDGKPRFTVEGAKVGVRELDVAARGSKEPFAKFGPVSVEGGAFDLQARRVSARVLRVADAVVTAKRDAKGELDLARIFVAPGADPAKIGTEPAAWRVGIDAMEFANVSANYSDATAKTPLAVGVRGLRAKLKLEADADEQGVRVRVSEGELAVAGLQAGAASQKQPALRFADILFSGVRFDSGSKELDVASARVGEFGVDAAMDGGKLSLLDLLPVPGGGKSEKPLAARVKSVELAGGSTSFADRATGVAVVLDHVGAKLGDVSSDMAKPLGFELAAGLRSGGRIGARGRAVPKDGTFETRVEATGIALAPLQPLMTRYANAKLTAGEASLAGTMSAGGKNAKLIYAGTVNVTDTVIDEVEGARLIGWKSLATDSLRATLSPNRVDIDELRWTAPAGKLAIAADRTTNVSRAFARKEPASAAQQPAGQKDTTLTDGEGEATFPVAVRRVRVEQGELEFSDDSVRPGFVARIQELAGTANGLSTDRSTRSQFTLEGRVGEFGFASLSGSLNPFALRDRTNFRVQFRNLDLTTVSPYSIKFAGYRVASGRLSMDLNYRVRENTVEGDNKITLEQFTLGERVQSPDALDLPIELAVSLLRDPDGRIDLAVPVTGNLDDPKFNYGAVIWGAIGNLIRNVITAPFRALAHLFGGAGEEVGTIAFEPGGSRLLPPEREKLGRIVEALAKRPGVKVVIPARYDAEADARAMKRAAFRREVGKRAGFTVGEDEEAGPISSEDRPTRAALRELFAERFSSAELDKLKAAAEAASNNRPKATETAPGDGKEKPLSIVDKVRNFASGEPQVADSREFYVELVRRLQNAQPIPANALSELAQKRGASIEAALKAAGADAARMSQSTGEPTANAEAKQVTVQLSLAAR